MLMAQFLIWQPVSLLASTWAKMSIFSLAENSVIFFGSLIMMKNESKPEI
jgi:hypothetical protein